MNSLELKSTHEELEHIETEKQKLDGIIDELKGIILSDKETIGSLKSAAKEANDKVCYFGLF